MRDVEIFLNAPKETSSEELADYLDAACGGDRELRAQVEELIEAERGVGDFMHATPLEVAAEERPGALIGNYKLLQEIGAGGFGTVYMAEQLRPVKRRVALKIIKLGMDTKQVVARFEAERQALAMMDHPNIAKVLDAGATDTGRPYFVMELVRGIPITEYCDENQLSARERLLLFREVCRGVQHAHQKGVIHRDLKPTNVLVTMHDDKAVPVIIDFGVAKATQQDLTDMTIFTRFEQFIGTPAYMSPEQAQMSRLDVDTRSDIYALGVLLYELLTGTTPYDAAELARAGQDEVRRMIREEEPPKPSTRVNTLGDAARTDLAKRHREAPDRLGSRLRGDLDWIVMKALEKDRTRRYETANAFAEDVRRFLEDEPVIAVAPSAAYRFRKYARRNRAALTLVSSIAAVLVVGSVVSTLMAIKATTAERLAKEQETVAKGAESEAREAREEADRRGMVLRLQIAEADLARGDSARGVARLAQIVENDRHNRVAAGRLLSALTQRDWQHQLAPVMTVGGKVATAAEFIPAENQTDHDQIVLGGSDGVAQIFDLEGKREGLPMDTGYDNDKVVIAVSPDRKLIAVCCGPNLGVWERKSGKLMFPILKIPGVLEAFQFLEFSPDSKWVLTGGNYRRPMVIHAVSGERMAYEDGSPHAEAELLDGMFSSDGRMAVTGSNAGVVQLWKIDVEKRTISALADPLYFAGGVWSVKLSRDDRRLVAGSNDGTAKIWELPDFEKDPEGRPQPIGSPLRHKDRVTYVEFSPDPGSERVLTASTDGTARIWDAGNGRQIGEALEHSNWIFQASFTPDGSRIITASRDGKAQVWDAETGRPLGESFYHSAGVDRVRITPDGTKILTAGNDGFARLWQMRPTQPRSMIFRHRIMPQWFTYGGSVRAQFMPSGKQLITGALDHAPKLWDLSNGNMLTTLPQPLVSALSISPNGNQVAMATYSEHYNRSTLWTFLGPVDGESPISKIGKEIPMGVSGALRFSPDSANSRLLSTHGPKLQVWDSKSGTLLRSIEHPDQVTVADFVPPLGDFVVTGCDDGVVRMWNVRNDDVAPIELGRHTTFQYGMIDVSPDGRYAATCGWGGAARVWDLKNPTHMIPPLPHAGRVMAVAFGPKPENSHLLATAVDDGTAYFWDYKAGKRVGVPMNHANVIRSIRFSPDGMRVVTASYDKTCRIWDAPSGLALSEPLRHDESCLYAEFSQDGNKLVTTGFDGTARVWDVPPAPVPAPEWIGDWARAAVGVRMTEDENVEPVDWDARRAFRKRISSLEKSVYQRSAEWFYQDPEIRPITPFTDYTLQDYIAARISEGTAASLQEAALVSPRNATELGKLAKRLVGFDKETPFRADFRVGEKLKALTDVLNLHEQLAGPHAPSPIELKVKRAWVLKTLGRLEEAAAELLESAEISAKELVTDRTWTGERFRAAGQLYREMGELDRALHCFDQALKWFPDSSESPDNNALDVLAGKSGILERLGRQAEAIAIRERLACLRTEIQGPDDKKTLMTRAWLAKQYDLAGDHKAALEHRKAIVEAWKRKAVESGELRIATRNMLESALLAEDWAQARELLEELVAGEEEMVSSNWLKLAVLHLKTKDQKAYQDLCRQMLDRFKDASDSVTQERTVKTCSVGSLPSVMRKEVVALAKRLPEGDENAGWNALARGMSEYRAGNHAEAIKWLKVAEGTELWQVNGLGLAYIAMALAADEKEAAQMHFEQAVVLLGQAQQRQPKPEWEVLALMELALEEAKVVLERQQGED
ncbi:protein kinase [Haloferula chungangensis]|uniref:Protein kinase n=1 Tax=Haloferula chungangensis TaxID=1048331 RepID=A0ABW2L7H2_9BACT